MSSPSPFEVSRAISQNLGSIPREKRERSAIDEILTSVSGEENGHQFDELMGTIINKVTPQNQKAAMQILQNKRNRMLQEQQKKNISDFYASRGIEGAGSLSEGERKELLKASVAGGQMSEFEKSRQKLGATKFEEAQASYQDALENKSRLDQIQNLTKDVAGAKGFIGGLIGGEKASELDALGLAAIEPVLKVFNPRGALAQQKVEMIRKRFAPKSTDLNRSIRGKLQALRAISDAAEERAYKEMVLYDKYNGAPPVSELVKFDAETDKLVGSLLDKEVKDLNKIEKAEGQISKEAKSLSEIFA